MRHNKHILKNLNLVLITLVSINILKFNFLTIVDLGGNYAEPADSQYI